MFCRDLTAYRLFKLGIIGISPFLGYVAHLLLKVSVNFKILMATEICPTHICS